jgi:hypothetical protein
MKKLEDVVTDIYEVLENPPEITESAFSALGDLLAKSVKHSMTRQKDGNLRMSNIGKPCERQLWYEINQPESREPLRGPQYMKFLFGHLIEEVMLWLAEVAGHSVEGRQDVQEIAGIKGHRDVVLDGVTVDAKSASTYSYKKFASHLEKQDDSFGYLDQIQSYIHAGSSDPVVTSKDRGAFLVVDKTLGNICLDIHEKEDFPIESYYERKKALVNSPEIPPRGFEPEKMGESGNTKLGVNCSYCDFKKICHPNLRTFLYSYGPVHFTEIKKEPKVPEVLNEEGQETSAE